MAASIAAAIWSVSKAEKSTISRHTENTTCTPTPRSYRGPTHRPTKEKILVRRIGSEFRRLVVHVHVVQVGSGVG